MNRSKRYSDLLLLDSFDKRFEYLKLSGIVGEETFGSARYANQNFYTSSEWKSIRDSIILRDEGCDLGIPGRLIRGKIIIHHINPISNDDLIHGDPYLLDPENLICTSFITHQAIHYGDKSLLFPDPIERCPNDTCPWKGGRL